VKFKVFFFLFLFFSAGFFAQQQFQPVEIDTLVSGIDEKWVKTDSVLTKNYITENVVYPKNLRPDLRNKYKGDEYNYTIVKPKESLWSKIRKRIAKILQSIFGEVDVQKTSDVTLLLIRLFAIGLIGFLLYVLIKYIISKEGGLFFSKKNRKVDIHEENLAENIHEINFSEEILKFENSKNFRFAVRYRFLQILKKLSDQKRIHWLPEKTNRDYISELKNETQKSEFQELVRIFDYVWYGEFEINATNYQHFKKVFNSFKI